MHALHVKKYCSCKACAKLCYIIHTVLTCGTRKLFDKLHQWSNVK